MFSYRSPSSGAQGADLRCFCEDVGEFCALRRCEHRLLRRFPVAAARHVAQVTCEPRQDLQEHMEAQRKYLL